MTVFEQGHAMVVGAGADLPNTVDDAVALADILKDPERCAYLPAQVCTLTGESARREHVLAALDGLSQSANPQSTGIIYFSGHGYQVTSSTGRFHFLMPYGYYANKLSETAISGTGMCGGCRVDVGGQIRFACVDGPKFDGHQVDWDRFLARQRFYLEEEARAVELWEHE